jgi:hypothetical protein
VSANRAGKPQWMIRNVALFLRTEFPTNVGKVRLSDFQFPLLGDRSIPSSMGADPKQEIQISSGFDGLGLRRNPIFQGSAI